jgi:hypothetical protein
MLSSGLFSDCQRAILLSPIQTSSLRFHHCSQPESVMKHQVLVPPLLSLLKMLKLNRPLTSVTKLNSTAWKARGCSLS